MSFFTLLKNVVSDMLPVRVAKKARMIEEDTQELFRRLAVVMDTDIRERDIARLKEIVRRKA